MDTRIYIAAHKEFEKVTMEPGYIPLHVGRAGKADLGYVGDDTGDSISEKNKSFCELTGLYWIWKNVQCNITGLCHYRRYFVQGNHILTINEAEQYLQVYDIIISLSTAPSVGEGIRDQYTKCHNKKDLDIVGEVIAEKCPEYSKAFEHCMNSRLISWANMIVAKKEVFDAYCQWLFTILLEVDKRIDVSGYDDYQKRVIGFLGERLLHVWLLNQKLRVCELPVAMVQ